MANENALHRDTLDMALDESRAALEVENDRVSGLETRLIALVGFAGFTLPVLGGLLPDAFSGLGDVWRPVAVVLYTGALALLAATIIYSLLASRGSNYWSLSADALAALSRVSDALKQRQDLVEHYDGLVRRATAQGALLSVRVLRASFFYLAALLTAVTSICIIGLNGGL